MLPENNCRLDFINIINQYNLNGMEDINPISLRKAKIAYKINPVALRKAKIVYNFGLSECNRVNKITVTKNTILILIYTSALVKVPCLFFKNNEILICMNLFAFLDEVALLNEDYS